MAWRTRDVMDEKVEFVIRARSGSESLSSLCREFGITRPTGYLWIERYEKEQSITGLIEKSRRPKSCPHQTKKETEERIVGLRKKWGWGAAKLQVLLKKEYRLEVPLRTINRVLNRRGLIFEENRIKAATKRFEREKPNQLWQMDFKGEYRASQPFCFPLTLLDDHSRFSIGVYSLKGTKTELVDKSLIDAFEKYGVPDAILTDHGSPWWSTHSEHGLTRLSVNLIKQGIKLYYSGVGHPQTQGKIERFHRTLNQEILHRGMPNHFSKWQKLFDEIRNIYNNMRPHEALAMKVPASRYKPSTKQYNPNPKSWDYPYGANVLTIDTSGCLRHRGTQFFVSHALIGEQVQAHDTTDSFILTYRHMIIREINKKTGVGTPFPNLKV